MFQLCFRSSILLFTYLTAINIILILHKESLIIAKCRNHICSRQSMDSFNELMATLKK